MSKLSSGRGTDSALAWMMGKSTPAAVHQAARMLQLLLGKVHPHRPRPGLGQRDGPLRRSAAELEDVEAFDIAEHLELAFGHLPHPPTGPPGAASCSPWSVW